MVVAKGASEAVLPDQYFSVATFHLLIFFRHQKVITHFRLSDAQHSTHAPSSSRGMKTCFATAQQSSLLLCSWKTRISQRQEFNILTSLCFPVFLSNSKPDDYHNALTAGIPSSAGCISLLDDSACKEPLEERKRRKPCCSLPVFSLKGENRRTAGAESTFRFCPSPLFESSLVINFPSSNTTSFVIPL